MNYCIVSTPLSPSCEEGILTLYPSPKSLPEGIRDVTALRCSEPLRYKVGGPSKVFAIVLRDGTALLQLAITLL